MGHVTFTPAGRMGNFVLECLCAISYALDHDMDFTVPLETSSPKWSPLYFLHLQDHSYNRNLKVVQLWENGHHYQTLPFEEEWRGNNIIIEGYRQSFLYSQKHRQEILYLLDLPHELIPAISLHARFGDYLTVKMNDISKHVIVDEPYITEAIKLVKEKTGLDRVKVFSDDLPYFRQHFGHLYDFEYSTNTNEYDDFVEISRHHSNINSSSTFSLCAAWLNRNPDKVVVTQKHWFGNNDNWMNLEIKDIVPPEFIKL